MVWSGSEVLLWGGDTMGGAWNPSTDSWRTLPTAGQPAGLFRTDGAWTGTELIIWGGSNGSPGTYEGTGARYRPTTNSWQPMSTVGAPSPRWLHRATWTGSELMVFGGFGGYPDGGVGELGDGALYDPASDSWRPLPSAQAPTARVRPVMVLAGHEVIVFGGCRLDTGARFDLRTNQWTPMSTVGAPLNCVASWSSHAAAWTGTELLVVGGYEPDPAVGGARYDPRTDTWSALPRGDPCSRTDTSAVWTGDELLVWGGAAYAGCSSSSNTWAGFRFRPATNAWVRMSTLRQPQWGERVGAVWTGSELMLYGARDSMAQVMSLSGRYQP